MKNIKNNGLRTWVEVDKKSLKHNYNLFRKIIGSRCALMAVVKSNAYGHGLLESAKEIKSLGVNWFCVDSIVEALALRKAGIKNPMLVLGYTLPNKFSEAAKNNISLTISSWDNLKILTNFRFTQPLKIHIKIDTGMSRQGFAPSDANLIASFAKKNFSSKIALEGVYTHFAAAKNPSFTGPTMRQFALFQGAASAFENQGFKPMKHAAATSATLIFPTTRLDAVRVGIGMYGLWPSKETEAAFKDAFKLKPALSWRAVLSEVKELPKGSRVGYDLTEALLKKTKVAICPIGYWHGYPRSLSSIGRVIVGGGLAKVLGRVSMDMIALDISSGKAKVGDVVTLIGRNGKLSVSADDLAYLADTTNYEIVTRINPLIKRFYI